MRKKLVYSLTAGAAALALAACAGGSADPAPGSSDAETPSGNTSISVGIPAGWDEGVAVSHLWAEILEQQGYQVTLEDAEIGVIFASLAGGDSYDLMFDAWLPITHESYIDRYGDDMEDLGKWYEGASLTIAVNSDAPITSLEEFAANADAFDGRLVGIDPGAGLTQLTESAVIPGYGLEDIDFIVSSTSAMLAELSGAQSAGDNIAVTLWRPHWAYDEFDIRDLEDPKGTLGDDESIHTYARTGFTADFPEVAAWIKNFTFSDEQLTSLENIMFNELGGEDNAGAVKQWLEANPDFIDNLIG